MFDVNVALARRHEIVQRAQQLATCARELTTAEQSEFDTLVAEKKGIQARLDRHAQQLPQLDEALPPVPAWIFGGRPGQNHDDGQRDNMPEGLKALAAWVRGDVLASDTPLHGYQSPISPGLETSIPTSVLNSLAVYIRNDAFQLAGATILNTPDTTPLVKPIISAGPDADTFVEGQSATDSHPMDVQSFTFGGTKYSRLVKVSEEQLMNSALNLPAEIVTELLAGVANTFTKAITTALVTALHSNPDTFVSQGSDNYASLLALKAAVPPRFESDTNVWMMSRHDLNLVQNTRNSQDTPLFDAESGTIFSRKVVINDNLTRVVYGSWGDGAWVRKSPFTLLRLNELYSSTGHVGFKGTQYLDSKFLASVDAVETQPLFYTNLETAGS